MVTSNDRIKYFYYLIKWFEVILQGNLIWEKNGKGAMYALENDTIYVQVLSIVLC